MVVVPGWPQKYAKDYIHTCTIITIVQAIFPYEHSVMSDTLTYICTSSPIADCFPESTVTLDVEMINGWFIMLVSALLLA